MPASSKAQQKLMALAEHAPSKVSGKNKGVLKMSKGQLHDFASSASTVKKASSKIMKARGGSECCP